MNRRSPMLPLIRPVFDACELENLRQCLLSGHVTQGPFVARFEAAFARQYNIKHALAVTSCTSALHLALLALNIQPGDEVIVPAFTWVATANAVEYVGATPVFVDIDPATYTLDPEKVKNALTVRTKAIIPVHLFGLCAPMDALHALAHQHDVVIIEDAACATGSKIRDTYAGNLGDIACFSFHPRKVITTGEGGMLTTNTDALHQKLLPLRNHGASPVQAPSQAWHFATFEVCGYNFRMSDLQAAVGCAQMEKVDAILHERARIAAYYAELLANQTAFITPYVPQDYTHSWQSYVIRVADNDVQHRNEAMQALSDKGIESRPGTHAVHRLHYYAEKYQLSSQTAPNAALCEDCSIALPMVHGMSAAQQESVITTLLKVC